ncbi:phage tail terminator protein, partial [Candidatus Darwinibacter acetoxidans]
AECPSLKTVTGIAAMAQLKPGTDRNDTPAAYVHLVSDRGGQNKLVNGVDQRLERQFGVLLSLSVTDQSRGQAPVQDLEALLAELRAGLVGWQPAGAAAPVLIDSGALRLVAAGVLWWLEVFSTAAHLRRV